MKDQSKLAFPIVSPDGTWVNEGMTLREHYAGLAMQGAITAPMYEHWNIDEVAELAVRHADALIEALSR